jgi:hypothetical protein
MAAMPLVCSCCSMAQAQAAQLVQGGVHHHGAILFVRLFHW